jgi:SAM-dependent methyltransferase
LFHVKQLGQLFRGLSVSNNHSTRTPAAPERWAQDGWTSVPVMDYEGSGYRTEFWDDQGREYEDRVERAVLNRLLPPRGQRLAEVGAGFGRLADLYQGYEQVILFDYSRTMLQDAVRRWGHDRRFIFVAGNLYQLPLAAGVLDVLVMVRVMHHLADVPRAMAQIRGVLHQGSVAVLEYANKRNLKAILRWLLRRQFWSPFTLDPVEFVELNFNFHPQWMEACLSAAGLQLRQRLAASHFRLPLLKHRLSPAQLVWLEQNLFRPGGYYPLSPSVFLQAAAPQAGPRPAVEPSSGHLAQLFRCPRCGTGHMERVDVHWLCCRACSTRYEQVNGIWDFKSPHPPLASNSDGPAGCNQKAGNESNTTGAGDWQKL